MIRIDLLLSRISPRTLRVLFDWEFDPSCLDACIINDCRNLKDITLKEILGESQWNLLFPLDGGSNSSTFVSALMVILLRNLTIIYKYLYDALNIDDCISKSSELFSVMKYRIHLLKCQDGQMESSFVKEAWSDIVGAVERLCGQSIDAECQELRTKTLGKWDHFIQRSKKWKMNEYKLATASQYVLEEAPGHKTFCLIVASFDTGKTIAARHLVSHLANEGYDTILVSDIHEIPSLIHTGGFCKRKLYVVDDIFQHMDVVRYESVTKECSPSEIILIDCEDFYRNCFRLKKSEKQRKVMPNIKTEKKQGGNFDLLDRRKAENNELTKMYKHHENENKCLSVTTFEKATYRQRNVDEYSIESTDRTTEMCMITLMNECSKTSQFKTISTLLKLCTTGTKANCVENRREQHSLHKKGKNIEESECYNITDTPWKEKHVLLERVAKIEKYCDHMFAFVARSLKYSEDQTLWLEMHTEDLLNTAYKRLFQLLGTPDGNEDLCGEHINNEEVCGVSVHIDDGAFEEQNQVSKQQLIECQMCIDQNNALYWCNNCRMSICSFCKMYHETVWTVMNHEVYPLHMLS